MLTSNEREQFAYQVMTEGYLRMFRGYRATGTLPPGEPLGAAAPSG